jgi:hypothetical protein
MLQRIDIYNLIDNQELKKVYDECDRKNMAFATFLLANGMLDEYKMIKKLFIKYQSRDIYKLTKQLQDFAKKALKRLKGLSCSGYDGRQRVSKF